MENWFQTLSRKELTTWLKNMSNPFNMFLNTDEDLKNLQLAKSILKQKNK